MDEDWAAVAAWAAVMEVDAGSLLHVMERSVKNGVSAEVVLEGYLRTISFWSEHAFGTDTFEDFESCPPGLLDLRVLDQSETWVDVLRTPHRIADRDDVTVDYLANIIGWLQHFADSLASGWAHMHEIPGPVDEGAWLESTVLMRGLRAETLLRGLPPSPEENGVGRFTE